MGGPRGVAVESMLLALWLGAAAFFSFVVARAAFAVLPTRTLAGALVGRLLPVLFISGMLVGTLVVLIEWPAARERWGRLAAGLTVVAACAIAQFVVAPRIERLRAAIGGPLEMLAADDARRAAFGRLHAVSVGWLGIAIVAATIALVLIWRTVGEPTPSARPANFTVPTDG
jgi:hypothetical protein